MKIEQQIVSFELAKRLKDAGYPQDESEYYWLFVRNGIRDEWVIYHKGEFEVGEKEYDMRTVNDVPHYAAYTPAELGEWLPYRIREIDDDYWLNIQKLKYGGWELRYKTVDGKLHGQMNPDSIRQADIFADAMGEMLLYLKEKGLL